MKRFDLTADARNGKDPLGWAYTKEGYKPDPDPTMTVTITSKIAGPEVSRYLRRLAEMLEAGEGHTDPA